MKSDITVGVKSFFVIAIMFSFEKYDSTNSVARQQKHTDQRDGYFVFRQDLQSTGGPVGSHQSSTRKLH